ncbi:MAG: hypothetical protein ACPGOY_07135 [Rhodospirillaceae bacterium]
MLSRLAKLGHRDLLRVPTRLSGGQSNNTAGAAARDPFPVKGEPPLSDLLDDPVMDVVLTGNGTCRQSLESLIEQARSRLKEAEAA